MGVIMNVLKSRKRRFESEKYGYVAYIHMYYLVVMHM